MPWWNREVVQRRTLRAGVNPDSILSDPVAVADGVMADVVNGFLEVERIDSNSEIRVFRFGGSDTDELRALDASPIVTRTTPGLSRVPWPIPPPPCLRTRVELVRTGGASDVSATVRLLQSARRSP